MVVDDPDQVLQRIVDERRPDGLRPAFVGLPHARDEIAHVAVGAFRHPARVGEQRLELRRAVAVGAEAVRRRREGVVRDRDAPGAVEDIELRARRGDRVVRRVEVDVRRPLRLGDGVVALDRPADVIERQPA